MREFTVKYFVLILVIFLAFNVEAKKRQVIAPSYAWTISDPLGLRYPSTIDTIHINYHKKFIPSMMSNAWATTGNYGTEGQNQLFFDRPEASEFFFEDAQATWIPSISTQRFYNTRIPMTIVGHATGGDKYSNQDRTQVLFSGNVNRKTEVGGCLDYVYSKGSYDYQAAKDFRWGFFGSYIGDRYEMHSFFNGYDNLNKESGGIIDDRFITDPAAVQGGDAKVSPKDILTNLTATHSKIVGREFYMNHRYKVGYYHYERDPKTDTIKGKTYIPVTSFIWTFDYKGSRHKFINTASEEDTAFFDHTYLGLGGTDENTRYWSMRNTVGISLLEGFNKYAKFGFAVYGTHELRRFTQVPDTVTGTGAALPEGLDPLPVTVEPRHTDNLFWVGGQLTKRRGSILTYDAQAEFGVMGDVAGDMDISGDVSTRFRLLGDTVTVRGYGHFKNLKAPYLMRHFISNHYAWNNDFEKMKRFRLGGELHVPFTGTNVNVGYETLDDYVFFGLEGSPVQHGGAIHVLSATLNQKLHFMAFHWDNELTYQTCSNEDVLPLPKFSVYSNLYFTFTVAKVLHCQLGVDGNYYTKYYAPAYNPATMTFHRQNEVKCGNFAFMNAYANFRMKQARFFIMYSHANKGMFGGKNYFAVPHYPLNLGRFQLGVSVNFIN